MKSFNQTHVFDFWAHCCKAYLSVKFLWEEIYSALSSSSLAMSGGITKEFNAVKCKCDLTELKTKSVCVPLRVCGIVMHTCQCICLWFLFRRLCQCIQQGSALTCILHLRQCMRWACVGNSVQSVFCCPLAHGYLVFVVQPFYIWTNRSFQAVPPYPPFLHFKLYTIKLSVRQVPFFCSAWVLMAELPGIASHGSSLIWELAANSGSSWMSEALNLHLNSDAVVTLSYQPTWTSDCSKIPANSIHASTSSGYCSVTFFKWFCTNHYQIKYF